MVSGAKAQSGSVEAIVFQPVAAFGLTHEAIGEHLLLTLVAQSGNRRTFGLAPRMAADLAEHLPAYLDQMRALMNNGVSERNALDAAAVVLGRSLGERGGMHRCLIANRPPESYYYHDRGAAVERIIGHLRAVVGRRMQTRRCWFDRSGNGAAHGNEGDA